MPYIGKEPVVGNFVKLDAISVVNGQAAYTMNNGGSAFTNYDNVNQFLVSLNGVLQAPTDSFTVSGSTLTFASNLVTGDVIDFVIVLGNTLDIGTPSDNTVSLAKLTATGTKDATTFLRGDNTFATISSGLSEADTWRVSANAFGSGITYITSNWERTDDASSGYLGTGMSQASGVFTFPSTGYWLVGLQATTYHNLQSYCRTYIDVTINNSTYDNVSRTMSYDEAGFVESNFCQAIIDVTDVSNVKVKFAFNGADASSGIYGDTATTLTGASFLRLGDT